MLTSLSTFAKENNVSTLHISFQNFLDFSWPIYNSSPLSQSIQFESFTTHTHTHARTSTHTHARRWTSVARKGCVCNQDCTLLCLFLYVFGRKEDLSLHSRRFPCCTAPDTAGQAGEGCESDWASSDERRTSTGQPPADELSSTVRRTGSSSSGSGAGR